MNIYNFELKNLRSSILIWGLSISVSLLVFLAFFPTISANTAQFDALMENYPKELLEFFGMNPNLPMSSFLGYLAITFGMMQIPLAIQAANYGFHMLSVEEREMTADFLLSKPISRAKIMISKFLASFTALTIINVVFALSIILAVYLFKGEETVVLTNVFVLLSTTVLFQLYFVAVGMLISVSVKKIASVISFSMALGFGLYILNGLKSTLGTGFLAYVTPYAYFDGSDILVTGQYDMIKTIICASIIILSLSGTYYLYLRRNIHSL